MPLTISLPDEWKEFIDSEAAASGLQTPADYVEFLLTLAQLRKERERVEALLDEGLRSGPSQEWTSQDWDDMWSEVERRHEARNNAKAS